jgi:hypothetical protein
MLEIGNIKKKTVAVYQMSITFLFCKHKEPRDKIIQKTQTENYRTVDCN